MKEIFEKIVNNIEDCVKKQVGFLLTNFKDCEIVESDYSSGGATLYGKEYIITQGQEKIVVTYESKDKCSTFLVRPDMNIVTAKYYDNDGKLVSNYSNSWEDRY